MPVSTAQGTSDLEIHVVADRAWAGVGGGVWALNWAANMKNWTSLNMANILAITVVGSGGLQTGLLI